MLNICKVARRWLFLLCALLWGMVGVMLVWRAYTWLVLEARTPAILLTLAGLVLGLVIFRFGFSRIADKNIERISHLDELESIFAFQTFKSYVTIGFMMGLGFTLRHSPLPKPSLAVLYAGIGTGLFLSSLRYYPHAR